MESEEQEQLLTSVQALLLSPDESNVLLGKEIAKGLNFNAMQWLYRNFGWLPNFSENMVVGQLLSSRKLEYDKCKKICIGDTISMFQELEELHFAAPSYLNETRMRKVKVSPNINQLSKLKKLTLHSFGFTMLPEWVSQLAHLEYLDCSANRFQVFPKYQELPPLITRANFKNSQFKAPLDESWTKLPVYCLMVGESSFTLYIRGRQPITIWFRFNVHFSIASLVNSFPNLEELYLYDGWHLSDKIWESIENLKSLKILELGLHRPSINPNLISPKILELEQLESLALVNTNLESTRHTLKAIAKLPNLKTLKLSNASPNDALLSDKWKNVFLFFPHLQHLALNRLGLTEIPATILHLPNLKVLDVRHNAIKELPAWLKTMPNLTKMEV